MKCNYYKITKLIDNFGEESIYELKYLLYT